MSKLQHSIFLNLSRHSKYNSKSRYISESYAYFTKNRDEEIQNEFELVDYQGRGRVSRQELMQHLSQKYGSLDYNAIDNVLATMNWDYRGEVTKQEFCQKYLARQRQLYSEANRYFSLRQKVQTTRHIFNDTKKLNPTLYAIINIDKVYIKSEKPYVDRQDMMSLQVQYEDHRNKVDYLIQQPVYGADEPSFQLLLPTQENYFFVRYKFINPKSNNRELFGQCYVNYPIADILRSSQYGPNNVKRVNSIKANITKNNEVKGYCEFTIVFESDMQKIESMIRSEESKIYDSPEKAAEKQKEYQYLQYLWGIRHKYPHKIARQDIKWMIITRIILGTLLAVLSVIVHCLGRCQPLSFILALMIFKNWKYVILRGEKFTMTWLVIAALCLDFIWISFASDEVSMINFLRLVAADIFTYILIIVKMVLLLYMLLFEKSFSMRQDDQSI